MKSTRTSSTRCGFAILGDEARIARMSMIDESGERYVRMAHLACVGSHAINGVAELHSELLKSDVLKDFYEMWPQKFSNKTNGVTPRRWMVLANPSLAELISEHIGNGWIKDLDAAQGAWNRWPRTPSFAPAGGTSSMPTNKNWRRALCSAPALRSIQMRFSTFW